jgi:hypothetical protein
MDDKKDVTILEFFAEWREPRWMWWLLLILFVAL